ncbi:DUF1800 domain-containing protein [Aquabacterium sp.]|uniref:DUF1800 domain-containing protein n=1 Tax=Aquabacterium sp. TaxID=1872578 RepID=UPI0025C52A14|nr:DUF1800 domain-containing protein [Aquabacterium sp.]
MDVQCGRFESASPSGESLPAGVQAASLRSASTGLTRAVLAVASLSACTPDQLPPPMPDSAARFLGQATLAATPQDIDQLTQLGWDAWLDQQFAMPASDSLWGWMMAKGFGAAQYKSTDVGIDNAIWSRLLNSPDTLRQRVVLALSEIFVVSVRNMPVPWGQFACAAYWDLLEAECFGNFRTLIERITLSPAMGVYLSMRGSSKEDALGRRPDENFARELLQLFTIGLVQLQPDGTPQLGANGQATETYGNDDITGLARVFTGWDFDRFDASSPAYTQRAMVFNQAAHSAADKTFLGTTIAGSTPGEQALKMALDTICQHPNAAPFVARRLIQRLTSSNPSADYVGRVAAVFQDNGQGVRGDMKAVIRTILLDVEVRLGLSPMSSDVTGKLREPVLRFLQWARVVRPQCTDGLWNVGDLSASDRLGQSPMRSPSVFNFFRPAYVPPQSALAQQGLVAPEFQITDECTVIGYANFMFQVLPFGAAGVKPDYADWLPLASDPAALVDRINLVFTGRALSAGLVSDLVTAITTLPMSQSDGALRRVITAMLIVLCSPEYLVQV